MSPSGKMNPNTTAASGFSMSSSSYNPSRAKGVPIKALTQNAASNNVDHSGGTNCQRITKLSYRELAQMRKSIRIVSRFNACMGLPIL